MSNNINNLDPIREESDLTTFTVKEFKEETADIKYIALVDIKNKRRLKKSVPTLILNTLERLNGATLKELESALVKSPVKPLKEAYKKANNVRKAKGYEPYNSLRAFVKARIIAVKRYYTAKDVIRDVFNGKSPLVTDNGKFYLTYSEYRVKS